MKIQGFHEIDTLNFCDFENVRQLKRNFVDGSLPSIPMRGSQWNISRTLKRCISAYAADRIHIPQLVCSCQEMK